MSSTIVNNSDSRDDKSTLSNYTSVVSQDIHLTWNIDFTNEIITGSVSHTMKVLKDNVKSAHFDTAKLDVQSALIDGVRTTFWYEGKSTHLGIKLCVEIPTPLRYRYCYV
jgi:leukotriene-A4 hydrolase